jgi:hypothetical protein
MKLFLIFGKRPKTIIQLYSYLRSKSKGHYFKERINEILSLQKKHHQIIDNNEDNPAIQQTSLAELHRLNMIAFNTITVHRTSRLYVRN